MDTLIIMVRECRYSLQDSRVNTTLRGHQELTVNTSIHGFRIMLGFSCEYNVKNCHLQDFNVNSIFKISVSSSGFSCEYQMTDFRIIRNCQVHVQEFAIIIKILM